MTRLRPLPMLFRWRMYRPHPMAWLAGPRAIRARHFWAAEKPWNRPRRKVTRTKETVCND